VYLFLPDSFYPINITINVKTLVNLTLVLMFLHIKNVNFMTTKWIIIITLCISSHMTAQQHFTAYDDLPGINKSFKPTLREDAPVWAKMMYTYPVNYNDLKKANENYQSTGKKKNPYTRY